MRFRKPVTQTEPLSDRAHNLILTTDSILSTLANQGVNTFEAGSLLREAKNSEASGDYGYAIERAETAKLALLRAKREHDLTGAQPAAPETDAEFVDAEEDYAGIEEKGLVDLSKLPNNYMQAKFMLSSAKDLLDKKDVRKGKAYDLYKDAEDHFDREEYSKALTCAIKSERLLDSDTLDLIGEEERESTEELVEIMACPDCEAEVTHDDKFCRKCGETLEFKNVCPGCEEEVSADDVFCRKCGQKLE